jgi:hypothetical protein
MVFRGPLVTFDYVAAIPRYRTEELEQLAGRGSKLAAKYKVHLQHVTVATMPEDHESRLKEMFPVGHYGRRGQSLYAFGKNGTTLSRSPEIARNLATLRAKILNGITDSKIFRKQRPLHIQ